MNAKRTERGERGERGERRERGSALVISMVMVLVIAAVCAAMLSVSTMRSTAAISSTNQGQAMQLAELAAAHKISQLSSLDFASIATTTAAEYDDASWSAEVLQLNLSPRRFQINATGTVRGISQKVEVVVEQGTKSSSAGGRGAIVSNGDVKTLGSITIDGRDFNEFGTAVVGNGMNGVSSGSEVDSGGSSAIGGNGIAPINMPDDDDGVYEENTPWANGVDDDGDGLVDEEPYNGKDDDGDGLVDEDLAAYPPTPDSVLGLTDGTLKATAKSNGTYFDNQAAFDAWAAVQTDPWPGGLIIYLEYDTQSPMNFPSTLNDEPILLVHHVAAGNANMKNLHGQFKGLLITDTVTHINGDAYIVGGIVSLAPDTLGNAYGNGAAIVRFSSEVLADLPGAAQIGAPYDILSWRPL